MQRTRYAFQARGDRFVGGDQTYGVAVGESGIVFRPDKPNDAQTSIAAAPLRLGASTLTRDGADAQRASGFVLDEQGVAYAEISDSVRERVETRPNGVEQSWELDDRPAGSGDLVVRLAVTGGQQYVSTTSSGLHFRDPSTGLGAVYGHATWRDADGASTTLLAAMDGTDIVLRVPETVVDNAHYPAVLDPVIGPELAVDTPVVAEAVNQQDRRSATVAT